MQPLRPYFGTACNKVGGNACFYANFAKSVRIRTVLSSHHKDNVHELGEFEQCGLAILCCIADILRAGADDVLEPPEQGRNDPTRIVDAQRGLRHVGNRGILGEGEGLDIVLRLHKQDRSRNLANSSFHLRVAGMTDQDHRASLAQVVAALSVDLRHERAGRVQHAQAALGCFRLDLFCNAMRTEDRDGVRRHFGKLFDEPGAARLQRTDDPFVVHDFVPHVDRRPILVERTLDNFNRTYDAGAEAARLRQNNFHQAPPFVRLVAACRRRRARSSRSAISDGCNSGACLAPKTSNTFATIPFASRPALAYMAGGESWSMNTSGSIMLRTLKFVRSSAPTSARNCMT